ncbi:DUF692 domain-containing protein [Variovorax dokdonensis]|uniref:UPF0276 protein QTH91_14205 n=1 Tax=Variovorax dokdonensis TaxID=344883 RepID=A0ABT7NCI0_9BURK|nr:DUF692 domain-containing protein [Variovorax dokdonensis]MDM0045642.1 DUF692 domain-containing protein [Variovorax dokdonensis]
MTHAALLAGMGLKPEHYDEAASCEREGLWFEVHPENYLVDGGPRLHWLRAVRERHPVSLHGVSLSLAGQDRLDEGHLARLASLARMIEPALVSEHLAWSAWKGQYFPDLLPFPRTAEALVHVAARIAHAQDALGRRIAIENPSHYLRLDDAALGRHDWDEIDFLAELVRRTGCGLLLDVNNVHVSAHNLGFDACDYLDRFPAQAVMEIHLAGHSRDPALGDALLIDSHDAPIAAEVWALYARLVRRIGARPTLIERDGNLPEFTTLLDECETASAVLRQGVPCHGEVVA